MLSNADRDLLLKALEMYGENTDCEGDMDALYQRLLAANEEQIKHMVYRFLGWRLPKPWNPDNGISYQRPNYAHAPAEHDWPTGTNLFDATQAEAMVRHMLNQ